MDLIAEKVDALFSDWNKPGSPGAALAVIRDGEIFYKTGYGSANLEYGIPISPRTIFHVASVSKQFTAMAVVLLAQDGKLSLDDEVRTYIPELPDFGRQITIRHLIHHTSGLRDQWDMLIMAGWRMEDVITTQDALDLVRRQKALNFEPGAEYLYCNTGYTLLGVIVERTSGKTLRAFCQDRIFVPLGMQDTHFHNDYSDIVPNRAYSYEPKKGGGYKNSVLSFATDGATSLFTTVEDLARWDQNFTSGKVGGQTGIDQMHQQGVLNDGRKIAYAFGLTVGSYRGLRVVEHSGSDAGFRAHLIRFPEQRFSVAILTNLSTFHPGELARKVADLYLADSLDELESPSGDASGLDLASYAGLYYNPAWNESYRLEMRNGKLFFAGDPGLEILPFGPDRFKVAGLPNYQVHFSRAGGRRVLKLLAGGELSTPYEQVDEMHLPETALTAYTGVFFSSELDETYRLEVRDGCLGITRRKYGFAALQPTVPDGFRTEEFNLLFSRDPQGCIDGFGIGTGRVRHLRFDRIEAPHP